MERFFSLLGLLLFLMGLYGVLKIGFNILVLNRYPMDGAIPQNILISDSSALYAREIDCISYPQSYYGIDGNSREPTKEEQLIARQQEERCLKGLEEDKKRLMMADINKSAFLVFLGLGLVFSKKLLPKT